TPREPPPGPSQFITTGTRMTIGGFVTSPTILMESGDGPDTITATTTSVLTAAYPWTAANYPPQLGDFPYRDTRPTTRSQIAIYSLDANDLINVVGVAVADNIDVFGGNGRDTINLTPSNLMLGTDIVFGDNGSVGFFPDFDLAGAFSFHSATGD